MAEIPVERKEKSSFPWWLIPLLLLLLLIPFLYFCNKSAVVDNTNNNYNANRTIVTGGNANNMNGGTINGANTVVVTNTGSNGNAAFNEEERIREANERARVAMEKVYPNGTPQQVIDALNLSVVNFAKNSAEIPAANKPLLQQAAEQLKKSPADTRVEIDGYTDNDGDAAANQKLSERRAESVRSELVRLGVPSAMLSTKGFGETQPKASNDTPEGRFENRRIEYKVATSNTTAEKVSPNANNNNVK
ncbi:MAG: OmpA family protein [Acidobacteriota bacterium]|nr:OmpA family protein [Acidobacteriota bacterium]